MAKISYRRLASAMVELLDTHPLDEVAAAAAEVMTTGGAHPSIDRLVPELGRELARKNDHIVIHAAIARKLPDGVIDRLCAELTKQVGGRSYEIDTTVEPTLLGGARLTTSDASLDLTLATQLQNLRISHG